MRSERAKAIIHNNTKDSGIFTEDTVFAIAEEAVELAEEDAREMAARTFCKLQRLDCEVYCTPCTGAECVGRNEFLKYYDNEN